MNGTQDPPSPSAHCLPTWNERIWQASSPHGFASVLSRDGKEHLKEFRGGKIVIAEIYDAMHACVQTM